MKSIDDIIKQHIKKEEDWITLFEEYTFLKERGVYHDKSLTHKIASETNKELQINGGVSYWLSAIEKITLEHLAKEYIRIKQSKKKTRLNATLK